MSDARPTSPSRRRLLAVAPTLGITSLLLPSAAAAASDQSTQSTTAPLRLTVDDTITPDGGDDVAYRVTVVAANGSTYSSSVTISVAVTVDDGADGGAGSPATGTSIEGTARTTYGVTTDTGTTDISIDLPGSGNYLVLFTTTPVPTGQPEGVTLARTVA